MTLYLEEEGEIQLPLDVFEVANRVIESALDYLECPYDAEVNLLLTTDEEIQEMNKMNRGIDASTDVLSFPMVDFENIPDMDALEELDEYFHPETGELMLGDIVISKEHVFAQAEAYGHSIKREFAFLIAHSMLHLFGYDHMEEEERVQMEEMQEEILEQIHITRESADDKE